MATSKGTWKAVERRCAGIFGCLRQCLSGSAGRGDRSRSDSTHETLFIETKLRETHSVRTLHDSTKELAKKEGKTPVLMLCDKGRPGCLICVHSDDFEVVVQEWLKVNGKKKPPV